MNEATGFEVGALFRRDFRATCDMIGLDWTEHKGLLSSTFVARGRRDLIEYLRCLVEQHALR